MSRLTAQAQNAILRVAHHGAEANEGNLQPVNFDLAVIKMGQVLGISDDPVIQGALERQGLEAKPDELSWSQTHSHWDEHGDFPVGDWKYQIENGDTRQGYADWVDSQIELAADDAADGPGV